MSAKQTSEDKLLSIIENPNLAKEKKLFNGRKDRGLLNQLNLRVRSLLSKGNFSKLLQLKIFNKIFIGVCVCATIFLAFDFIHQNTQRESRFEEIKNEKGKVIKTRKDFSDLDVDLQDSLYLAESRSIFSLISPKKEESVQAAPPPVAADYSADLKNLKVVGILWSEKTPQVMIEDVTATKTHLLVEGDTINEFEIKDIQKDFVIFKRDSSEWKLR